MGNGFDISFLTSALTNVGGTSSVNNSQSVDKDIKTFDYTSDPIANSPVYTEADLAEMFELAGIDPVSSEAAPEATSTTKTFAVMEAAGLDLADLDEIFADEPDVVAHTLTAFQNGSASRIERQNQSVATLIENLPEGTTETEFEAFMYAFNDKQVA